jgi:uncharacterized protein YjiK
MSYFRKRGAKPLFFYGGLIVIVTVTLAGLSGKEESELKKNLILGGVIQEPSGLTFHPDRETLIAVGDEGQVVELTQEGEVIANRDIGGDLEAITADPHRKILYAVEEKEERLFLLDWDTLEIESEIDLQPFVEEAGLDRDRNDGFEAIAFQPADEDRRIDRLILGHQHRPATLLFFTLDGNPPQLGFQKRLDLDVQEVAGLCYDPKEGSLWLVCDKEDRIYKADKEGKLLTSLLLPGSAQEGIVFSPEGDLFVADDDGGIFRYPSGQFKGDIDR